MRLHEQLQNDSKNPQFEKLRRLLAGGGYGNDPLFSGAVSRREYLPAGHGLAVAVNLLLRQILLHALSLLVPLHRLFHRALGCIHFYSQSRPPNSSGPATSFSLPSPSERTLPRPRG